MATLANLAVNISANTAAFQAGMQKAQKKTAAFRGSINGLVSTLAGPLAAGAFLIFAKRTLASADSLAKTADKIGITITKLQELRFVADRAGVSAMALDSSMERFTKRMGEAAQGTGEAIKVFEQFGISLTDVEGNMRDSESVFHDVMEGLASLESPAERAAAAAKVFGREGVAMVNMIKDGIVPMDEMIQRAHDLGIVLEEDVFRQAEAATDAITDMTYVLKAKFTVVVAKVLPFIIKSFTFAQLVVNGLKLAFFGLAWATGKVITGIANAWEWLKSIMSRGMAFLKGTITKMIVKILEMLGSAVFEMAKAAVAMGMSGRTLFDMAANISALTTTYRRQAQEIEGSAYQAQKYNDIMGIQAWAIDGVNKALAENARLRREMGRGIVTAPRMPAGGGGGGGAAAIPLGGGGGGGGAAAAEEGEWALGGPFGEAGSEVWLQETGIALAAMETMWALHLENLWVMKEADRLRTVEAETEYTDTALERLQKRLQSLELSEQEHADKIAELKLKTLEDMNAALKAGIIDYFAALGAGANGMKALKGIMIGIAADTVAGLAQQWGIFYFLSGAAKVASSIWPPNAQGIAGGLKEMAAGSALMLLAGAAKGAAASAGGGDTGGAADSAAAATPFGATGAPGGAAEGAEDTADGSGLVVNIHVEGHIVDEQKFLEEVVMPNMAKAVGRGAAYDGQYDMISERT